MANRTFNSLGETALYEDTIHETEQRHLHFNIPTRGAIGQLPFITGYSRAGCCSSIAHTKTLRVSFHYGLDQKLTALWAAKRVPLAQHSISVLKTKDRLFKESKIEGWSSGAVDFSIQAEAHARRAGGERVIIGRGEGDRAAVLAGRGVQGAAIVTELLYYQCTRCIVLC